MNASPRPTLLRFKSCACGHDLSLAEWLALPTLGVMGGTTTKNCPRCSSTIGVDAAHVRRPTLIGIPAPAVGSAPTPTRPTPVPQSGSRYSLIDVSRRSMPPGSSVAHHIQTRNV